MAIIVSTMLKKLADLRFFDKLVPVFYDVRITARSEFDPVLFGHGRDWDQIPGLLCLNGL